MTPLLYARPRDSDRYDSERLGATLELVDPGVYPLEGGKWLAVVEGEACTAKAEGWTADDAIAAATVLADSRAYAIERAKPIGPQVHAAPAAGLAPGARATVRVSPRSTARLDGISVHGDAFVMVESIAVGTLQLVIGPVPSEQPMTFRHTHVEVSSWNPAQVKVHNTGSTAAIVTVIAQLHFLPTWAVERNEATRDVIDQRSMAA